MGEALKLGDAGSGSGSAALASAAAGLGSGFLGGSSLGGSAGFLAAALITLHGRQPAWPCRRFHRERMVFGSISHFSHKEARCRLGGALAEDGTRFAFCVSNGSPWCGGCRSPALRGDGPSGGRLLVDDQAEACFKLLPGTLQAEGLIIEDGAVGFQTESYATPLLGRVSPWGRRRKGKEK